MQRLLVIGLKANNKCTERWRIFNFLNIISQSDLSKKVKVRAWPAGSAI